MMALDVMLLIFAMLQHMTRMDNDNRTWEYQSTMNI